MKKIEDIKELNDLLDIKCVVLGQTPSDYVVNLFKVIYKLIDYPIDFVKNKIDKKYFVDPASTKYHNSEKHGLLYHSLNTALLSYKNIIEIREAKISNYINDLTEDEFSIYCNDTIFAALFHDYGKVSKYLDEEDMTDKQWWKIGVECIRLNLDAKDFAGLGKSSASTLIDRLINNDLENINSIKRVYRYDTTVPKYGHSEDSIIKLLQSGIKLSDHQLLTIRYHMMSFDPLYFVEKEKYTFLTYQKEIPMLRALYLADVTTSLLYEKY